MPEQAQNPSVAAGLSDRIQNHRKEALALLQQGGEQPQYEYKRSVTLGRDNLGDRLDFVKLVQAVANAEASGEHCVVIGGDTKEKKFYPVTNTADFDPANLSKILGLISILYPYFFPVRWQPTMEPFILIELDSTPLGHWPIVPCGQNRKARGARE